MADEIENKKLTMKEIASIAMVSPKTVSRVINHEKYVKKETEEKIKEVIDKYRYTPNFFASGLRTGRSNTFGLIIGGIENLYYAYLSNEIISYSEAHGYNVIILCNNNYDDKQCVKNVDMLLARNIDALIVCSVQLNDESIKLLNNNNIPFIQFSCPLNLENINFITADDYYGGILAAEHVIKLGHKKIFYLRMAEVFSANERLRAFKNTMKKNNISCTKNNISKPLYHPKEAYDETLRMIKSKKGYTAIIAANDTLAISAIEAISDAGLKIPDDISIIGYDNLDITKVLKVPLTTVNSPQKLFGNIAVKRLIEMLDNSKNSDLPIRTIVKPELIVRDSCKKLAIPS